MKEKSNPKKEAQELKSNEIQYRKISSKQLEKILEQHQKWLESEGKKGKRANLNKVDLAEINLSGKNLSKANISESLLEGANLQDSDLSQADLTKTVLSGAELEGADLQGAVLEGAELERAKLEGAWLNVANFQDAYLYQADFQGAALGKANLKGADLYGANLKEAILVEAELQKAILTDAELQGADLYKAILRDSELLRTCFKDASLQDSDLTATKGLSGRQLAGADVSGAELPEAISKFEGLKTVEDASKNARRFFFAMLLGCVYSTLTIATTTDISLLTNSSSSPLPIIGTKIPIVGFYFVAPVLLLGLYFYFHLYLQRLWEGLAGLPAVFPDGKPLNEKVYPWLLNGLVCAQFKLLKPIRPRLSRLQAFLSILLAWWIMPVTLFVFWARCLPRHQELLTTCHVVMVVLSIVAAILLYCLASSTLRGDENKDSIWKEDSKKARAYMLRGGILIGLVALAIAFYLFSLAAINGVPSIVMDLYAPSEIPEGNKWVPKVLALINIRTYADFFEADVSEKPENWTGLFESELPLVKGARLKGRDLRYAYAMRAFLVNSDLRDSNLQRAYLLDSDLREAKLRRAILLEAKLQRADLRGANLQMTDLRMADFKEADLRSSDLGMADFMGATLQGADLREANLRHVKNLTVEQLCKVKTLIEAKLDPELEELIKKKCPQLLEKPEEEELKEN